MSNPLRFSLNSSKISSFSFSPFSPSSLIFPKSGVSPPNQTPSSRISSLNVLGPLQFTRPKRLASFKLCKTAQDYPNIIFLKVNFDENKSMCKSLNVKMLPCFHFYRGSDGLLESFSCSLAKFQKIKDAIAKYDIGHSSNGQPKGVGNFHPS